MGFSPHVYLRHILDEADFLVHQGRGLPREQFVGDATRTRAFAWSLEVIGAMCKEVPEPFRMSHPEVRWQRWAETADRLIVHYFAVDYDVVWDLVTSAVPDLRRQIGMILAESPEEFS
ncbi:DUF86 domain-containing protein [Longimicrobium sp.]|jgi:uncharacterized protein with HEPN domain|uniref:HepT-like ribonuclease domain-containing protein n=1 Tax=Longimicrobium sp. TaxID=2029185 RepID=UPI002ED83BB0